MHLHVGYFIRSKITVLKSFPDICTLISNVIDSWTSLYTEQQICVQSASGNPFYRHLEAVQIYKVDPFITYTVGSADVEEIIEVSNKRAVNEVLRVYLRTQPFTLLHTFQYLATLQCKATRVAWAGWNVV